MLCLICGVHEVESVSDACLDCLHTGRAFEFWLEERGNLLTRLRELECVLSANLWPTGAQSFQLSIILPDRFLMAGWNQGEDSPPLPAIPPEGMSWALLSMVEEGHFAVKSDLSDSELVAEVKAVGDGEVFNDKEDE